MILQQAMCEYEVDRRWRIVERRTLILICICLISLRCIENAIEIFGELNYNNGR